MPLILDDKQPVILVPDNSPVTALSAIGKLDWLLIPGVPVKITDQVADEATRNRDLPWAQNLPWVGETCRWIVNQPERHVRILASGAEPDRRYGPLGRGRDSAHLGWRVFLNMLPGRADEAIR